MLLYALAVTLAILVWLLLALYGAYRARHARRAPAPPDQFPSVTIVVSALNEERVIEPAMRSLLTLDYPRLDIVAVDDRSTDATGMILDRLAGEHPDRLRVVHVETLPPGWLGKCHALSVAAPYARGEWLLFTDADVLFEKGAIQAAMSFAVAHRVDHIVLFPRMIWHGYVEAALLALFTISLAVAFRTWRVESPSLRAFIGIGAFNMIRRELYERFGGHEPLRMEVADDMKLGYLAKKHGGRSMAVDSDGMVRVRWREGARDIARGIERSGFAGVDFRWEVVIAATLFYLGILLAPLFLPFLSDSIIVLVLSVISSLMLVIMYALTARAHAMPIWIGVLHPIACALFIYGIVRSAVVTTLRGGLSWRGTFYSIEALKRGSVR